MVVATGWCSSRRHWTIDDEQCSGTLRRGWEEEEEDAKKLPRLSRVQSGNANYTQFIYGLTYATLTPTGWLTLLLLLLVYIIANNHYLSLPGFANDDCNKISVKDQCIPNGVVEAICKVHFSFSPWEQELSNLKSQTKERENYLQMQNKRLVAWIKCKPSRQHCCNWNAECCALVGQVYKCIDMFSALPCLSLLGGNGRMMMIMLYCTAFTLFTVQLHYWRHLCRAHILIKLTTGEMKIGTGSLLCG